MTWISHISKSAADGHLHCHTQGLDGLQSVLPIHRIPERLKLGGTSIAATLDSKVHSLDNISLYLNLMGWEELAPQGQSLHRFTTPSQEIWIPSQLLVQSLHCKIPPLSNWLLSPRPPTESCRPIYGSPTGQVDTLPTLRRTSIWASGTAQQRLGWLVHSRSAMRSWASTYRHALDGRLDCAMPDAVLECWLRGAAFKDIFCVTSLKVASISCEDIYTRDHESSQVFQWSPKAQRLRDYVDGVQQRSKIHLSSTSEVSDVEVDEILDVLYAGNLLKCRATRLTETAALKRQLNALKIKEQTRCRWAELPGEKADIQYARKRFASLTQAGKWEAVRDILLKETRS